MQSLTHGAKGLTLNDDLEKTQQERLDIFYQFVKVRKAIFYKFQMCFDSRFQPPTHSIHEP